MRKKKRETRLTLEQRSFIADKLMDSANYILAGVVINEIVSRQGFSAFVVVGILLYSICWVFALYIKR